ncbi:Xyloside transporter XynT [Klebsiella pneumoniae]|nr:Xyloside transporter XynT [Klebsiella pneumoniae]
MAETTFTLWRQRLGYGIADLSCNLVWQMISLYLMFFLHRRHGSSRPIMSA